MERLEPRVNNRQALRPDGLHPAGGATRDVGYLLACPEPAARAELGRLRAADAQGVAAAEADLSRTTSLQSE